MSDPIKRHRRQKRLEAAYPPNPACVMCGASTIEMLVKESTVPVSVLEDHHVFGSAHHPLTGPLCRNCHAVVSTAQRDEGVILRHQQSFLDRLAHMLMSLGALLGLVGRALIDFARELLRRMGLVVTPDPIWRTPWIPS